MTQPVLAHTEFGSRYYDDPISGKTLPSVTTVTKSFRAWGLEAWKVNVTADRAVDNIAELMESVERDPVAAKKWLKAAASDIAEMSSGMGDRVHSVMERYALTGTLKKVPPVFDKPIREFIEHCRPEYYSAELSVFNPKEGYAGTLDAIALVDIPSGLSSTSVVEEKVCLIDYKTTKSVYPFEIGMQLAALSHCEYGVDQDGQEVEIPQPLEEGLIVHFRPDSPVELFRFDLEAPYRAFVGLLHAFEGDKEARKWMKRVR